MMCVEKHHSDDGKSRAEAMEIDLAAFVPTKATACSRGTPLFPRDLTNIIRNASLMYSTTNGVTFLNKGRTNSVEQVRSGKNHLRSSCSLQIPEKLPRECTCNILILFDLAMAQRRADTAMIA